MNIWLVRDISLLFNIYLALIIPALWYLIVWSFFFWIYTYLEALVAYSPCGQRVKPDILISINGRTLVPFRTSEILRIFRMGYINMYMVHNVAQQRLVRFTSMLPDNGQFFMPNPFWWIIPKLCKRDKVGPSIWLLLWRSVLHSLYMSHRLMFGVLFESSRTYTCMISSLSSLHSFFVVGFTKDQAPGV